MAIAELPVNFPACLAIQFPHPSWFAGLSPLQRTPQALEELSPCRVISLPLTVYCSPHMNGIARGTLRLVPADPAVAAIEVPLLAEIDLRPGLGTPHYDSRTGFSTVVFGPAGIEYRLEVSTNLVH